MGFIVGINALAKKYFRYMFWILFCIGLLIYYALIVFVLPSIEPYRPYKEMGYVIRLYKIINRFIMKGISSINYRFMLILRLKNLPKIRNQVF
jgi:hypothetical protein